MELLTLFGVGTARHVTCLPGVAPESRALHVPIGPSIASWELTNPPTRTSVREAHADIVTCLVRSHANDLVVSTSYSGEVAVWAYNSNDDTLGECKARMQLPVVAAPMDAAWSPDDTRVALCCDIDECVIVLAVEDGGSGLAVVHQRPGKVEFVAMTSEVELITFERNGGDADEDGGDSEHHHNHNHTHDHTHDHGHDHDHAHGHSHGHASAVPFSYTVELRDITGSGDSDGSEGGVCGEVVASTTLEERPDEISRVIPAVSGGTSVLLAAYGSRTIVGLHTQSLEQVVSFHAEGSGRIKSMFVCPLSGQLIVPSDNQTIHAFDVETGEEASTVQGQHPAGQVHFIGAAADYPRVVVASEAGLFSMLPGAEPELSKAIEEQEWAIYSLSFNGGTPRETKAAGELSDVLRLCSSTASASLHTLSCCGLAFHGDNGMVASGDFAGSVFVWDVGNTTEWEPKYSTLIPMSVRALAWSGDRLYIGDLDGGIHMWSPIDGELEPTRVASVIGGVTCMQWVNSDEGAWMIAGTTRGQLTLFQRGLGESYLRVVRSFIAHEPSKGPQDIKFGSLGNFAEVWSNSFSPDGTRFATASEDQTTVVWTVSGEKLNTLTGHTTAVTCVDWKVTAVGELLATCADDKKVMVWNASDWSLYGEFETGKDIAEWHTVTYMNLEVGGNRLVCGTQNGYVFCWDLTTKEKVFVGRMHYGSIEGLDFDRKYGRIASCSSDCTVNVYNLL